MKYHKSAFFFLNHTAHIYHAISVAFELSQLKGQEVTVYCSTARNLLIIKKLAQVYPEHRCKIHLLKTSRFYTLSRKLKKRAFPGFRAIFSNNRKKLLEHDTFVSPSDDILILKSYKEFKDKRFVYTKHGSGNFSYDFSDRNDDFDLVFLSGNGLEKSYIDKKYRKEHPSHAKYQVVGYPKFDLCSKIDLKGSLFNNKKPTVVYIPHFKEHYNSWPLWGDKIMKFFGESQEYNLVLAPHVLLSGKIKNEIRKKYLPNSKTNILIDIDEDSENLINMHYTRHADIYLGDVSSQVYEFLSQERPCIFLNPYQYDWKTISDSNFDSWHLGQVVEHHEQLDDFGEVLESAIKTHSCFIEKQHTAIQQRFSFIDENTSRIAAKSISELQQA